MTDEALAKRIGAFVRHHRMEQHKTQEELATAAMYLLAILLVIAYSFVVSLGLYWLTNKMIVMRVSEKSERIGLDLSQHDECYSFADGGERELAEYSEKES